MTQPNLFADVRPTRRVSPVVTELHRRASNRDRVLARLQQGPATNVELVAIGGIRATGRISDLRAEGYDIPEPVHVKGGIYRYELRPR